MGKIRKAHAHLMRGSRQEDDPAILNLIFAGFAMIGNKNCKNANSEKYRNLPRRGLNSGPSLNFTML